MAPPPPAGPSQAKLGPIVFLVCFSLLLFFFFNFIFHFWWGGQGGGGETLFRWCSEHNKKNTTTLGEGPQKKGAPIVARQGGKQGGKQGSGRGIHPKTRFPRIWIL